MKLTKEQYEPIMKLLKITHGLDENGEFPLDKFDLKRKGKLLHKNYANAFNYPREYIIELLLALDILYFDEKNNPVLRTDEKDIIFDNKEDVVYKASVETKSTNKLMNGKKPKLLNEEQIKKINEFRSQGMSIREIGKIMGIGKDTVNKVIKGIY